MNNIVGAIAALILIVIVVMAYKHKLPKESIDKFKKLRKKKEERGEEVD